MRIFYVASPIPLHAQPAQSLLAAASGRRMLPARENFRSSELARAMTTTLSLIASMKFCFPVWRHYCARSLPFKHIVTNIRRAPTGE
jgi:hypothetical protein